MRRLLILSMLASGAVGMPALVAAPASAQIGRDRIIDIYGNDKCPSSNGQEIVVCHAHPEKDRYRIPKELRDQEPDPHAAGGNVGAVAAVNSTGQTGVQINSCNAIGGGVAVGCTKQGVDAWKAQKAAEKKDAEGIP